MSETPIDQQTMAEVLKAISEKSPTPGGGAVAPLVSALAAALGRMVVQYSKSSGQSDEDTQALADALPAFLGQADDATALANADMHAYGILHSLFSLSKDDPSRSQQWNDAVTACVDVPNRALGLSLRVLRTLRSIAGASSRNLRSDLAIAAILAEASARASAWNVRINLPLLAKFDSEQADRIAAETDLALLHAREIHQDIEMQCSETPSSSTSS